MRVFLALTNQSPFTVRIFCPLFLEFYIKRVQNAHCNDTKSLNTYNIVVFSAFMSGISSTASSDAVFVLLSCLAISSSALPVLQFGLPSTCLHFYCLRFLQLILSTVFRCSLMAQMHPLYHHTCFPGKPGSASSPQFPPQLHLKGQGKLWGCGTGFYKPDVLAVIQVTVKKTLQQFRHWISDATSD